jgi:uncharacterized protein YjbI with pentapeptide repeats
MSASRVTDQRAGSRSGPRRTPLTWAFSFVALALVAMLGLAGCGPAGTVRGTVTDASGAPVAGLRIRLFADDAPTQVVDAVTSATGTYTLTAPPGIYRLAATDPIDPYADVWFGQAPAWSSARSIDVRTGSATADLTVVADADAASISGLATGAPASGPLAGIEVRLLDPAGRTLATASTDGGGHYTFTALVPGRDYRLKFSDPASVRATVYSSSARTLATAPVLTPGAGDALVADTVVPLAGAISGTVRDSRHPLAGILVLATLPHTTDAVALTFTDSQGRYTIGGLTPEAYTVAFIDTPWSPSGGVHPTAYHGQTVADLATAPDVVVVPGSTLTAVDGTMTGAACDPARFHPGADLSGQDLSGLDLSACDLRTTDLAFANLTATNLSGSNLSGAGFYAATLTGADLSGANLTGVTYLEYVTGLASTTLTGANLSGLGAFGGLDLHGKDLTGTNFTGTNLYGTNLSGATVTGATFTLANLSGANLAGAVGVNSTIIGTDQAAGLASALLSGVNFADTGLDLSGLDLHGKDFAYTNLTATDLSGSNLSGAGFYAATLTGADLSGADLTGATYMAYATRTGVVWSATATCPDGTLSGDNGDTCEGHV